MRFPVLITFSLLLAITGCSSNGVVTETAPKQDLSKPIQSPPSSALTIALADLDAEYAQVADSRFGDVQVMVLQRLADLILEESEAKLLQEGIDEHTESKNIGHYKAIMLYEQLLTNFPEYQNNDQVRYQLARAYDYAESPQQVLRVLTELVEQHSDSPLYTEAQLRRGELLFTLNRFDEAVEAYTTVTAKGETSPYYKYALYKQSWAFYKGSKVDEAHHKFADLLDYLNTPSELDKIESSDKELTSDVLRVLALSFSKLDGAESIQKFLNSRDNKPYSSLIFQALAHQYDNQQLYSDAADIYRYYADHYVDHSQSPSYLLQAIRLYEKARQPTMTFEARESFVKRYGPGTKFWRTQPESLYTKLLPAIKEQTILLAKDFHAAYQKTKQLTDAMYVQYWYRFFLDNYSNEKEAPAVRFLYAESLFELGNYSKAAEAYSQSAYDYPPHQKSNEAGYTALISYEKQQNITEEQRSSLLIESSKKFLKHFPYDSRSAEVRHIKADQHLVLEDYQAAREELVTLIKSIDNSWHELLSPAWNKLSYCLFMLEEYYKAEIATTKALEYVVYQKDYRALRERLAASIYQQGEVAKREGNLAAAADHFVRMVSIVPNASIVPYALYDAATVNYEAGNLEKSAKLLELFSSGYPDHELSLGAREKLAVIYSETGNNVRAANAYSALAVIEPDPERKYSWLLQAADLYQQEGYPAQAINVLERYQSLNTSNEAGYYKISNRIADLEKVRGDNTAYRQKLKQIIDQVNQQRSSPGVLQQGAIATLALANSYYNEYTSITLGHPVQETMSKKTNAMKLALQYYREASEYHISSATTAATFHIAEIYRHLSQALLNSPQPKGLSSEEQEVYSLMLEEQVFPLEERAIAHHQLNIQRVENGIYDDWVKQSFRTLAKLQPVKFDKTEQMDSIITQLK